MKALKISLENVIDLGTPPENWVKNLITVTVAREPLFILIDYHGHPQWGYCLLRVNGIHRDAYLNRDGTLDLELKENPDRYFNFYKAEEHYLLCQLLKDKLEDSDAFIKTIQESHLARKLQLPYSGLIDTLDS